MRWKDADEHDRSLTVREAVYEGTTAGLRKVALPDAAVTLIADRKIQAKSTDQDALVFREIGRRRNRLMLQRSWLLRLDSNQQPSG